MSRIPCPVPDCPRPAASGMMCGACVSDLRRALTSVPPVVRDLEITLSRQTSRTTGGRTSVIPLPYDERASDAGVILHNALHGWVRQLQELQPEDDWPADTPHDMARWLSARLERLVRHPAAPEAHGEIVEAVAAARRVTDRPADRQFAGRCPGCDGPLYVTPGAAVVQCRTDGCDAEPVTVADQRDAMLTAMADQLMPAVQAADVLTRLAAPLPADTVRHWARKGRLIAHGYDPHGHSLYRVSDVRDLLVEKLAREAAAKAKRETRERERMSV